MHADVAVIGSGFGGSLTALLLERIGLRPVLLDRGTHPRFAIGESSTPVADLVLRDLARTYGLPRLEPLAKYGTWQAAYPEVVCGIKRGFSYFKQVPDRPFVPHEDHANELLVAASGSDHLSDTHWLRSDVDAFLVREVVDAGIPYFDRTELTELDRGTGWTLAGRRDGAAVHVAARFVVDATGEGALLPRRLGLRDTTAGLRTNSWSVFGHFADMTRWHDLLAAAGGRTEDHPYPCDHAALHQLFDEGWMWQLGFNNDVVSAGFALDPQRRPPDPTLTPRREWDRFLARYPAVREQFAGARLVAPDGGLRRTGRLQRRWEPVAGEDWALLPHTAAFIDPLHSSGIAQTLCGVERLVGILAGHWGRPSLPERLRCYGETVLNETSFVDELVHGCYESLRAFPLFATFSMLYFAAATTYERRRLAGEVRPGDPFLCADDPELRSAVRRAGESLREHLERPDPAAAGESFRQAVAEAIRPFNTAGLCDPTARNMYRYTALPADARAATA